MPDSYRIAREKYRPDRIRVLFIAESPPTGGGYFYCNETAGKDHLFRETMKALRLWRESEKMRKGLDKRPLLKQFQTLGLFLIDACGYPVDKLPGQERRRAISNGVPRLVDQTRELRPEKIIIVKRNVFFPVKMGLEGAGLAGKILNNTPIPFPSHGNQRIYRKKCQKTAFSNSRTF